LKEKKVKSFLHKLSFDSTEFQSPFREEVGALFFALSSLDDGLHQGRYVP